jgi:hypothetical protein
VRTPRHASKLPILVRCKPIRTNADGDRAEARHSRVTSVGKDLGLTPHAVQSRGA